MLYIYHSSINGRKYMLKEMFQRYIPTPSGASRKAFLHAVLSNLGGEEK